MDILGRYGNSGIDIEGTAESLRELSGVLEELDGGKVLLLSRDRPGRDPYPGNAESLRLTFSDEPVCIGLDGLDITISGTSEGLKILAQNIRFLANQEKQESSGRVQPHIHIEYYPGHFFLKAESEPLVVSKRERSRSA